MRSPTLLVPILVAALLTPVVSGCSTRTKTTTTTETIEYPAGSTLPDGRVAGEDTPVTVTRETHTSEEKETGCGGIVGCTAKVTWEIVKLPFRIVGFVLDLLI